MKMTSWLWGSQHRAKSIIRETIIFLHLHMKCLLLIRLDFSHICEVHSCLIEVIQINTVESHMHGHDPKRHVHEVNLGLSDTPGGVGGGRNPSQYASLQ